jgi:hypothetical protein
MQVTAGAPMEHREHAGHAGHGECDGHGEHAVTASAPVEDAGSSEEPTAQAPHAIK